MASRLQIPESIRNVLQRTIQRAGISQNLKRYELIEDWEKLVGPKIAEKSWPLKYLGGILIVEVEHPAWIQELNLLRTNLLEKIKSDYPKSKINNIRFVLR